jgi:hypothetical protein
MVTRADNGNSIGILPTLQHDNKIEKLLSENNFHTVATDPTNTFQNQVRSSVKQSKILIPKDSRWKFIHMYPSTLFIKGLITIHKQEQPIRPAVKRRNAPTVKWHNALAYQLSK